jgi:hypothetical protein
MALILTRIKKKQTNYENQISFISNLTCVIRFQFLCSKEAKVLPGYKGRCRHQQN